MKPSTIHSNSQLTTFTKKLLLDGIHSSLNISDTISKTQCNPLGFGSNTNVPGKLSIVVVLLLHWNIHKSIFSKHTTFHYNLKKEAKLVTWGVTAPWYQNTDETTKLWFAIKALIDYRQHLVGVLIIKRHQYPQVVTDRWRSKWTVSNTKPGFILW